MYNYFKYNNIKYIVTFNNIISIYKEIENEYVKLSSKEEQLIKDLLNKDYSYIFYSELLNNIIEQNNYIENKEYVSSFLKWLENIIPNDCRYNFYNNLKTLKTNLKMNVDLSKEITSSSNQILTAGYNTRTNSIDFNEESLYEIWKISKLKVNPTDFYWKNFAKTLLHELAHMSSTRFDKDNNIALCGFNNYPSRNEEDKNRALTEGFTEIICSSGVSTKLMIGSLYYIEYCWLKQLSEIIDKDIIIRSYFSNLGIQPLKDELNKIINNPEKSYTLFRAIEINYNLRNLEEEQSFLGGIQHYLLEYLDAKLDILLKDSKYNDIENILSRYEKNMVTIDKLLLMNKNPKLYIGLESSIKKFKEIKYKYYNNLHKKNENTLLNY